MAVDYFLKIDGIPGESTDSKHKDEIDVEAWSWGEVNPPPPGAGPGGGAGAGKVQMQDLNFTARFSRASPNLMLACASGKHLQSAVLTARRKDSTAQAEFLTFSLSDVLVSSYQTGGSAADVSPVDSVSLNFSKLQIEYKQQKADGSLAGSIKAGWDAKQNKQL